MFITKTLSSFIGRSITALLIVVLAFSSLGVTPASATHALSISNATANVVFGQGGVFNTGTVNKGGISANSLNTPRGVAIDSSGGVYVADEFNHRVLYYPIGSTTATRVYGQGGVFNTGTVNKGGISANSLNTPLGLALDGSGGLYVTDYYNHRVLYYPAGSTTATRVYGQGGVFNTGTVNKGGVSANSLNGPSAVAVDASGVYIADYENNRVLYYSGTSTTATRVYGQGGVFNTNTLNKGGISANSLYWPLGLVLDGSGNLYVADQYNNRVLYYTAGSTTATRVYGQGGAFNTNTLNKGGISANSLYYPDNLVLDSGGNLYVSDMANSRTLYYPAGSTTATRVYGQGGSFASNTANNGGISANSLFGSSGVTFDSNGNLYISDIGNHRLLVYFAAPTVTIVSVLPNPTNGGTTVTWNANDNGNYSVRVGGTDCSTGTVAASGAYATSPANVASAILTGDLAEGLNNLRVCVTDAASNTGSATSSVTKDSAAPTVTIVSVLPDPTSGGTTVTWNANENGNYSVRVGGTDCTTGTVAASGAYATSPANVASAIVSGDLAEGLNNLRVCVTDALSNTGSATSSVTKDSAAPTVNIVSVLPNPTSGGTTVTWNANENGNYSVRVGGTDCVDGTVAASGTYVTSPANVASAIVTGDLAEGLNNLRVCVTDAASNTGSATSSVTKDSAAPTVTIVSVLPDPTNAGTTVTWNANENGNYSVRVGGADCSTGTVAASGAYATSPANVASAIVTGDLAEGLNNLRVCVTDALSNTGSATSSVTKDSAAPSITSFARQTPATSPTNADTLVFRATFSEAVQNVDATDFAVTGTTATITGVAGVGGGPTYTQYDITVSGGDLAGLNGTVGLDLVVGQNITDLVGNALPAGDPSTDETYTLDNTIGLTSFARQTPATSPTNADTLVFRATFSEAVQNVDATDFAVTGTTATITGVTGVGGGPTYTQYDITVSGGDLAGLNGTVGLDLAGTQDITDLVGNALPAGEPSTDETYVVDNAAPLVATTTLSAVYADAGPLSFTVTFNEDVNNPAGDTDPDDVTNPDNYVLVEQGSLSGFQTTACTSIDAVNDTRILPSGVTYIPNTAIVNLGSALPVGTYRLFICGTTSIVDLALNPLMGNGIAAGTDFTFDFTVAAATTSGTGSETEEKVTASSLPDTGFAPNKITSLPAQPANLAYSKLGDLWLEIPSLNVKSTIVGVPQNKDNTWDVTWLGNDTGWLNGTAFPTWNGNSVLTAHVTNASGLDGPFAALKKLKYGGQVIIHFGGVQYVYEVRVTKLARPYTTNFTFESKQDASYLTLVTCSGYNPLNESYLFRRVVRAVLVSTVNE